MARSTLPVLEPNLQVSFYYRLQSVSRLHLQDALSAAIGDLDVRSIDDELNEYVSQGVLRRVAGFGLRGELFFPVPLLIRRNPFLLGYYRLLFGISQKEFYGKGPFGRFKCLEERGTVADRLDAEIPRLCRSLIATGEKLVAGLDDLSPAIIRDLQLLTIGPQFRGSENTRIGKQATRQVRGILGGIVSAYVQERTERTILVRNASGRIVLIEFAADPDMRITERLSQSMRPTLSIEVKGGADVSNVHNRLGEAEKSHQKAQALGFREFWTIIRSRVDPEAARRESPTTSRFFDLDRIRNRRLADYRAFRDLLASMIGIRS